MAKSIVYKHYQRALSQWPIDLLRPDVSFPATMRRRVDKTFKPATVPPHELVTANAAQPMLPSAVKFDEAAELEQVNVLYSFLENRYSKKYPLSDRLLKPASNPTYYEDLLKELDEAPRRSWFARMMNRWKGFIRFR